MAIAPRHAFGKTEAVMNIFCLSRCIHFDRVEKFCIYRKNIYAIKWQNTVSYNNIFKAVLNMVGRLTSCEAKSSCMEHATSQ